MNFYSKSLAAGLLLTVTCQAAAQPLTVVVPPLPPPVYPVAPPVPSPDSGLPPAELPDNTPGGLRGWLNRHGMACVSHHHWFGCGNFRSEATFIFGSCRTFYGEPCLPRQPREDGALGQSRRGIFGLRACYGCQ